MILYIAYTIKREGKFRANVLKTSQNNNLVSVFGSIPDLFAANVFPKNEAYKIAEFWNESYKSNNTYLDY